MTKKQCLSGPGSLTNLLQKAAVNVIDQADCQHSYGNTLTPNMMCAGSMEGGRDTCLVRVRVNLTIYLVIRGLSSIASTGN